MVRTVELRRHARPGYSIRGARLLRAAPAGPTARTMNPSHPTESPTDRSFVLVRPGERVPPFSSERLSSFFSTFLPFFVRETLRTGGTVSLAAGSAGVEGIFLRREVEQIGTIFARDRPTAEALYSARGGLAVYSEFLLEPEALPYPIYSIDLASVERAHRFAHPVRSLRSSDGPSVLQLMQEVYGIVDERWFRAPPSSAEHGFVAEVGDRIVGAAWLTVVGGEGRLHSLSVAPRYRHLGVGSDLWHARALFARQEGVRRVVTEIAETNAASRAISTAGGMQRIGQIFENRR
ncbi:MAG: GNAT family N-acetyltransferase [Thermoplasmata archaeon]